MTVDDVNHALVVAQETIRELRARIKAMGEWEEDFVNEIGDLAPPPDGEDVVAGVRRLRDRNLLLEERLRTARLFVHGDGVQVYHRGESWRVRLPNRRGLHRDGQPTSIRGATGGVYESAEEAHLALAAWREKNAPATKK